MIVAAAGTGKTTTLRALAKNLPSYVYLSFNVTTAVSVRLAPATTLDALNVRAWTDAMGAPPDISDTWPDADVFDLVNRWTWGTAETLTCADEDLLQRARRAVDDAYSGAHPLTHGLLQTWVRAEKIPIAYDAILVDEAQDLNANQIAYLLAHDGPRIFIGDPHQSIYGFRGADDRMRTLLRAATRTFHLTTSFRFGPRVARIANLVLALKRAPEHVAGAGESILLRPEDPLRPSAVIARTQAGLFLACVRALHADEPIRVLGRSQDVFRRWIRLARGDPSDAADGDRALLEKLPPDCAERLDRVERCMGDEGVVFATVHASKGLEFDHVTLVDDFRAVPKKSRASPGVRRAARRLFRRGLKRPRAQKASARAKAASRARTTPFSYVEEVNLLYVAITRAKRTLRINTSLYLLPEVEHLWSSQSTAATAPACPSCSPSSTSSTTCTLPS